MVLQELGKKITDAIKNMNRSTIVNDKILQDCLNDISRALL